MLVSRVEWTELPVYEPQAVVPQGWNYPRALNLINTAQHLIFVHIPKTAGTSLRSVVQRISRDFHLSMHVLYSNAPLNRTARVLYGHLARPPFHQLLPHGSTYHYIAFVQEPVRRLLSQFTEFRGRIHPDEFFPGTRKLCPAPLDTPFRGNFKEFLKCFPDHLGCNQWKLVTGMWDINCTRPFSSRVSDETIIATGLRTIRANWTLLPADWMDGSLQYLTCALDESLRIACHNPPYRLPYQNGPKKGEPAVRWEDVHAALQTVALDNILHGEAVRQLLAADMSQCQCSGLAS